MRRQLRNIRNCALNMKIKGEDERQHNQHAVIKMAVTVPRSCNAEQALKTAQGLKFH